MVCSAFSTIVSEINEDDENPEKDKQNDNEGFMVTQIQQHLNFMIPLRTSRKITLGVVVVLDRPLKYYNQRKLIYGFKIHEFILL